MKKAVLAPLDYAIMKGAFFVYQKTKKRKRAKNAEKEESAWSNR